MKNKFKLIPAAAALALGISISPAHAGFWEWAEGAVNTIGNTFSNAYSDVANWGSNAAADAADWTKEAGAWASDEANTLENNLDSSGKYVLKHSKKAVNTAVDVIETGANIVFSEIEDLADAAYQAVILEIVDEAHKKVYDPMENAVNVWAGAYAKGPKNFSGLTHAINTNNGPMTSYYLKKIFFDIQSGPLSALAQNFEDNKLGSLLVMFTVSAGAGAAGFESTTGIAIDIGYIRHFVETVTQSGIDSFSAYAQTPSIDLDVQNFNGPIASIFYAGGFDLGATAGGSIDLSIGYHVSTPDGVDGPGLDVSLTFTGPKGGNMNFGVDMSNTELAIVTGSIGISGGGKVEVSIGPSFAVVLGQLCSTGVFKKGSEDCPTVDEVDVNYDPADDTFDIIVLPEIVMTVIN